MPLASTGLPASSIGPPSADDVEVLEREAQRIDDRMAAVARRDSAGAAPAARGSTAARAPGLVSARFVSTPGGGGGTGRPKMLFSSHLPRSTGEVRSGYDVVASSAPCAEQAAALIVDSEA